MKYQDIYHEDCLEGLLYSINHNTEIIPPLVFVVCHNDYLYGIEAYGRGVIRIQLDSGEVTVCKTLTNELNGEPFLGNPECVGDMLAIVPFNSRRFYFLNLKSMDYMDFESGFEYDLENIGCARAYKNGNEIFFYPCTGSWIYKADISEKRVEREFDLRGQLNQRLGRFDSVLVTGNIYQYDDKQLFALNGKGVICQLDIHSAKLNVKEIGKIGFVQSVKVFDELFLLDRSGSVIRYNLTDERINKTTDIGLSENYSPLDASGAFTCEGKVYFLTPRSNWGIAYDISTDSFRADTMDKLFDLNVRSGEKYHYSFYEDSILYLLSNINRLSMVDLKQKTVKYVDLYLDY